MIAFVLEELTEKEERDLRGLVREEGDSSEAALISRIVRMHLKQREDESKTRNSDEPS
ncbi:MAG: hypothetical protein AAF191_21165 [Verrucomicrobiota bacterium]